MERCLFVACFLCQNSADLFPASGDEKVELDSSDESDDEFAGGFFVCLLNSSLIDGFFRWGGSLWTADPEEERQFYRAYNYFCQQKGTVLKRTPMLGFRDLDLFRLHSLVQREGGFEQVLPHFYAVAFVFF
jgi:hypothetical protein